MYSKSVVLTRTTAITPLLSNRCTHITGAGPCVPYRQPHAGRRGVDKRRRTGSTKHFTLSKPLHRIDRPTPTTQGASRPCLKVPTARLGLLMDHRSHSSQRRTLSRLHGFFDDGCGSARRPATSIGRLGGGRGGGAGAGGPARVWRRRPLRQGTQHRDPGGCVCGVKGVSWGPCCGRGPGDGYMDDVRVLNERRGYLPTCLCVGGGPRRTG